MRNLLHIKSISWVLLVVMLTVTLHCTHETAHAMQSHVTAAGDHGVGTELSVPHNCPCSPLEQHNDYDGCDTCINCSCHASLTVEPFQLGYNPILSNLSSFDPFRHLPEVYLTRFIPPQIHS